MSFTLIRKPHKNPRIDALTESGRLRWVLEFIRRDLDTVPLEEIKAIGDDLQHATSPWWVGATWRQGKIRECTDMSAVDVRALQQEIRARIQDVMGESLSFTESVQTSLGLIRPGGWTIEGSRSRIVRGHLYGDKCAPRIWRIRESTDERMAILEGVATLMVTLSDRLSICPVCETLFVRQHRQEYCTVRCSNKVRNRRRLDRKADQRKSGQLVTTGN